jgi:hypothetical protein
LTPSLLNSLINFEETRKWSQDCCIRSWSTNSDATSPKEMVSDYRKISNQCGSNPTACFMLGIIFMEHNLTLTAGRSYDTRYNPCICLDYFTNEEVGKLDLSPRYNFIKLRPTGYSFLTCSSIQGTRLEFDLFLRPYDLPSWIGNINITISTN